jgi:sulfite reductase beta subunit-like hemoprotein
LWRNLKVSAHRPEVDNQSMISVENTLVYLTNSLQFFQDFHEEFDSRHSTRTKYIVSRVNIESRSGREQGIRFDPIKEE